jgi:hypothetical protein
MSQYIVTIYDDIDGARLLEIGVGVEARKRMMEELGWSRVPRLPTRVPADLVERELAVKVPVGGVCVWERWDA